MIYRDEKGFPVDETSDGGDSAFRAGLLAMCGHPIADGIDFSRYEVIDGMFVRHPEQTPWNNKYNFSRDQAIPFITGMSVRKDYAPIRRFFYKRLASCFFMQNTERDYRGSTKHPYPHSFIDDKGLPETRMFDYADPLFPHHIGLIILSGKMYAWYWFLIIAYPFHLLALLVNMKSKHEQNQIICESYIYGTLKLYRMKKDWSMINMEYWLSRNEAEYGSILKQLVLK